MDVPTPAEAALAAAWRVPAAQLAAARSVLNHIARLDWPEPERVSLLARLARQVKADVGPVYARMALALTPLDSFDRLLPLPGIGERRARGLARALAGIDPAALSPTSHALQQALDREAAQRAEIAALRSELDRLYRRLPGDGQPAASAPMSLQAVAESIAEQVQRADGVLQQAPQGLRLGAVALDLQGRAGTLDGALALDFADVRADTASQFSIAFAPAGTAAGGPGVGARPVPDVGGYTETLARRRLLEAGFAVAALRAGPGGGVRQQVPAAGTPAATGSTVRLILG